MDTRTTWTAEGLNIRNPEGRVVAVAVPTTGEDAGADELTAHAMAAAMATATEANTMTAAFGQKKKDGSIDIVYARFSGQDALGLIQRIGAALQAFEGVSTEAIETMPGDVFTLARECAAMNDDIRKARQTFAYAMRAAKDDTEWGSFRAELLRVEESILAQRARPN